MTNKRILIIEDEEEIREVFREILEDAGFEVETAIDGVEGLKILQKGGFSLILLDIMMPKLDGLALLRKIHGTSYVEINGPIVLLTNLSHEEIVKEGIKYGAKTSLIKSNLTPNELIGKIKVFLRLS